MLSLLWIQLGIRGFVIIRKRIFSRHFLTYSFIIEEELDRREGRGTYLNITLAIWPQGWLEEKFLEEHPFWEVWCGVNWKVIYFSEASIPTSVLFSIDQFLQIILVNQFRHPYSSDDLCLTYLLSYSSSIIFILHVNENISWFFLIFWVRKPEQFQNKTSLVKLTLQCGESSHFGLLSGSGHNKSSIADKIMSDISVSNNSISVNVGGKALPSFFKFFYIIFFIKKIRFWIYVFFKVL